MSEIKFCKRVCGKARCQKLKQCNDYGQEKCISDESRKGYLCPDIDIIRPLGDLRYEHEGVDLEYLPVAFYSRREHPQKRDDHCRSYDQQKYVNYDLAENGSSVRRSHILMPPS